MLTDEHREEHREAQKKLRELLGDTSKAYSAWQTEVFKAGALDQKTKELISLAVSSAIQCEYCIDTHASRARDRGASEQELAEAIAVAAAIRAGAALSHGSRSYLGQK